MSITNDMITESMMKTGAMFASDYMLPVPADKSSMHVKLAVKRLVDYGGLKSTLTTPHVNAPDVAQTTKTDTDIQLSDIAKSAQDKRSDYIASESNKVTEMIEELPLQQSIKKEETKKISSALALYNDVTADKSKKTHTQMLILKQREEERKRIKPEWHAPWKLMRVMPGHSSWVRCVDVDVSNEWFATGGGDKQIKIWDLATGTLKVSLTGHISAVMGISISERHPYLFSVGQDKMVKCWDLEHNTQVRDYHGHLSGVYCCALHPELDLLMTGGRDSSARIWDIRSKECVRVLSGHTSTIGSIAVQGSDPQVITGSHDCQIRTWDIRTGKTITTLTHHKKSVRGLAIHPRENTFLSGAADNLKVWQLPDANFMRNLSGHNAIVNDVTINYDNVVVSAADNGSMYMWDWKTGFNFQKIQTKAQSGSMESEAGIFAVKFDRTGSRLITCEADKTVKIWKEDETASIETHPIIINRKRKL